MPGSNRRFCECVLSSERCSRGSAIKNESGRFCSCDRRATISSKWVMSPRMLMPRTRRPGRLLANSTIPTTSCAAARIQPEPPDHPFGLGGRAEDEQPRARGIRLPSGHPHAIGDPRR